MEHNHHIIYTIHKKHQNKQQKTLYTTHVCFVMFSPGPLPPVSTVIYRIQEDGACLYRGYRGLIRTGIEMVL